MRNSKLNVTTPRKVSFQNEDAWIMALWSERLQAGEAFSGLGNLIGHTKQQNKFLKYCLLSQASLLKSQLLGYNKNSHGDSGTCKRGKEYRMSNSGQSEESLGLWTLLSPQWCP